MNRPLRLGAIVLTGGSGSRMGGVDKAALEVRGVSLLERALTATSAAGQVVVVGPETATTRPVTWAREEPPGGGPAAGVLAGLEAFGRPPELVVVLAVDMPLAAAATVARLARAVESDPQLDGALLEDRSGMPQSLCAVYRFDSLLGVRPSSGTAGLSMRRLIADLILARVPAVGPEGRDVDTWADLAQLEDE